MVLTYSSGRAFAKRVFGFATLIGIALVVCSGASNAVERIKEVATISGVRANPLVGYGLVVGLDGTGDQTLRRRSRASPSVRCWKP